MEPEVKIKVATRSQRWLNYLATALLAVPMILEPLKGLMFEHFYGIVSSVVAVANVALGLYLRRQGHILILRGD
jgi:hypothetical protein